jgi:hypothetical protein
VTIYLASRESKELGSKVYNDEKDRGVSYLDQLLGVIVAYGDYRSKYTDFESYYTKVLDVFKK